MPVAATSRHRKSGRTDGLQEQGLALRLLNLLAAPQVTVTVFILAAAGTLWIGQGAEPTLAISPALALLLINLTASMLTHRRFRADFWLLVFHLALAALVVLFFLARMTYLSGQAGVTRGAAFDGNLLTVNQGPWHWSELSEIDFVNEHFVDEYPEDGDGYLTFNRLSWRDDQGNRLTQEIGDDKPLIKNGYRFYATRKGFAPRLLWERPSGAMDYADLRLGNVEYDGWHQGRDWQLPEGPQVWVSLDYKVPEPAAGSVRENLGVADIDAPIIVRIGEDKRHELKPGETLTLAEGRLTYLRLDVWMGYQVHYDPMKPWLIATAVIGIVSLIGYYVQRFFRRPKKEVPR